MLDTPQNAIKANTPIVRILEIPRKTDGDSQWSDYGMKNSVSSMRFEI